jgi:transposase
VRGATAAWATAGLPVVVVHPRQAREVARATGQWAKTAALEAGALAHVADVIRPPPRPRPAAPPQAWRALRGRRQQLLGLRTAAPHRLAGTSGRLQRAIAAHIAGLKARLATLGDALETLRRASPLWREHDDLVQRVPGMGPGCARTLLRALREWGTLTRQQIAAVVGGAPRHGDSGPLRGRRLMWGGRAPGRPGWYMGTRVATRVNPRLNACSQRLLAAGKGKKVALTAGMQKWLTMLTALRKQRTSWHAQEIQNEKIYQAPVTTKTVAPLLPRFGFRQQVSASVR